ncbi:variable large family protein, partial [Borreliella garinii]|uniref:variable large family protein n=1 Tax=Borreliella garinii TaxID=29519 RepID=UPI001AEE89A2
GAVSGEQILSAIVAAAGSSDQDGKAAGQATNAIEAAIGGGNAAEFGNAMKKKNDQIAAALVLKGIAKDGKFASAAGAGGANADAAAVKGIASAMKGIVEA